MINKDRIVPVTAVDLISLYGLILLQDSNNSSLEALAAAAPEKFAVATNSKVYIAAEPLKALSFGSSITACTLYFVPALDFDIKNITKASATLTITAPDAGIAADGHTLYSAVLSTNALTITKVGF